MAAIVNALCVRETWLRSRHQRSRRRLGTSRVRQTSCFRISTNVASGPVRVRKAAPRTAKPIPGGDWARVNQRIMRAECGQDVWCADDPAHAEHADDQKQNSITGRKMPSSRLRSLIGYPIDGTRPGRRPPSPEIGRNADRDAPGAQDVGGQVEVRHTVDDDGETEPDADQGPDKQKSKFADAS
jgi:hypothetical protein